MKTIRKQIQTIFLCLCMALLAGCAGKSKSENMEWRMKDCEVEGLEGAVMEIALISGQEFYATTGIVSRDEVTQRIYYVNLDTKKAELIPVQTEANFYLTDIVNLGDSGFAAFLSERDDEMELQKDTLVIADRTGKVLRQRKVSEITGGEEIVRLLATADGKILPVTAGCVYCLDETLSDVNKFETATQVEDAVLVDGERVICICADHRERENSKVRFSSLNLTKGAWEKDFKGNLDGNELVFRLMNGRGGSFFLSGTKGIYECSESGMITPVLRWNELSLTSEEQESLTVLPEEGFLGCTTDYESFRSRIGLFHLEVAEKSGNTLVVGGVGMDDHIVAKMQEYGKKNPDVKVEIKEYEYEANSASFFDACNRLYVDVLAGNGPDVIYLQGLDYLSLIQHGYLENLDMYYEKDAEISKEDLIPSFRDAISVDGSMYYLAPELILETLVGKTSLVGDSMGWTMQELYDLWENNQYAITADNGISTFRLLTMGVVEKENVDLEEYKLALEMAKREYADSGATQHNAGFKNDKVLLAYCGMTQPSYVQLMHSIFDEEEITLKGFPGVEGSGAMFTIMSGLAISSQSQQKDMAWEMIRSFMTKEYQSVTAQNIFYFPTRLDCFEEMLLEYARKNSKYNFDLGMELSQYEDKVVITALSNEDVERIKAMVFETRQLASIDKTIINIVNEEAGAYFSGEKDVDTVCEVIRNRIELYRKEE